MDSASYLENITGVGPEGAVFNRPVPYFSYDYQDQNVKQVAEHIFHAYHMTDSTDPAVTHKKKIPGWMHDAQTTYLTRNYPEFNAQLGDQLYKDAQEISKKNRNAKNAECAKIAKGNPEYECDEFPFASTAEGGGQGDFSVRYVPRGANGSAGGKLSTWYARDRILHGDEIQIFITNYQNIIPASLISRHSGKALDIGGRAPGFKAKIWTHGGQPAQDFSWNEDKELRVYGNSCLDGGNSGASVTNQACSGSETQKWEAHPSYAGSIVHKKTGLCLDVRGAGTTNGTLVHLWTCSGSDNQKWDPK
ncbi:ricin-type beta-trefoil lectin domain protein [Streptomyces sp. RerS4]|uniref:ricin-type beta-trefoil lectin domain protein n=1 Tax=Streptomyces sp. RerS4 TaxID=2942449 RepID=UPI00201BBC81|nr:ricin-type beta-trefoil lectin domain protein [Streptomyces sp. RerS4]UQW99157.1 ricin-type beta-trefoil lectin domain protein [Streptomyces sp. RerS4]